MPREAASRAATRAYASGLADYKDEVAKRAGYKSFEQARRQDPEFMRGVQFRSRADFGQIWDRIKQPARTEAEARDKMRALEALGRHVKRSWEKYLSAGRRK